MHQSITFSHKADNFLLVIGGLTSPYHNEALNSVVCIDLSEISISNKSAEDENENVWVTMASLNRTRHSFGSLKLGDGIQNSYVYVFGGIQGRI